MDQCPFANLLDPGTYAEGMPCGRLAEIRESGSVVKLENPITGVPYWVVTQIAEMDTVSKNPTLFSSAARSAFPMEYDQDMVDNIHCHTIINMDPPQHQKVRRIVRNAFTPKRVESYAPKFREHAKRIVDAVVSKGACEFVEEVAAELPLIGITTPPTTTRRYSATLQHHLTLPAPNVCRTFTTSCAHSVSDSTFVLAPTWHDWN